MAKFNSIEPAHRSFIENQKIFFVATAPKSGKINLSPKGLESFHIDDEKTVYWLNLTGSGNETQAHLAEDSRMTIMFNSFDRSPLILRLYGTARTIRLDEEEFKLHENKFPNHAGARQIIEMKVDLVQTSCGFGVPFMEYKGERDTLNKWATKQGDDKVRQYWQEKNSISLDGKPIEGF
jgi:predicted pyridoxine 5'-phosphate oxidase superfamily flavin-nucleotide-binding protein